MNKQVVLIGGGDSFPTREAFLEKLKSFEVEIDWFKKTPGWKDTLEDELGGEYEVFYPSMPNQHDARYKEWKVWFEKLLPLLGPEVIVVGHSLGAQFLAAYLSREQIAKNVLGTFLVAAPFELDTNPEEFKLPGSLELLEKQGGKIFFYQSKDDKVISMKDLERYREKVPNATYRVLDGRGHFNQPTFPELVEDIKNL